MNNFRSGFKFALLITLSVSLLILTMSGPACAATGSITLSGHINYEGPDGVLTLPENASVSARYDGHEYMTKSDAHGDYSIGPIPGGNSYILEFKINYTDPQGNYYVWPADGWHQTLFGADGKIIQDMILIKSANPVVTPVPVVTATPVPSPTATPTAQPSPTALPSATVPAPTDMPLPTGSPTPTPKPTATPSAAFNVLGTLAVLAVISFCYSRKK